MDFEARRVDLEARRVDLEARRVDLGSKFGEFLSEFGDFLKYQCFYENIKVAGRLYESFPISSSSRSLLCVRKRMIMFLYVIVDLPALIVSLGS